jgi:hypothetical protein
MAVAELKGSEHLAEALEVCCSNLAVVISPLSFYPSVAPCKMTCVQSAGRGPKRRNSIVESKRNWKGAAMGGWKNTD